MAAENRPSSADLSLGCRLSMAGLRLRLGAAILTAEAVSPQRSKGEWVNLDGWSGVEKHHHRVPFLSALGMSSERQIRQERIDLQLGRAGWAVGSLRLVEEFRIKPAASPSPEPVNAPRAAGELSDYVLLGSLGQPLAIIEAKRSSRDPEQLFEEPVLTDLLDLVYAIAA